MILTDVNVLVYAHRRDVPQHEAFRQWLEEVVNGEASWAVSEHVLAGFLRVVTHPRVFDPPSSADEALAFCEELRGAPNAVPVAPGRRHWSIFTRLCQQAGAKGNLVPDAYLAALAIESGCEWITTDRDFSRFPGLRWRHPLS